MAEATIPVVLDTDIGTNVDDALALAYLLRQPRCELLGVTTVSGEAVARAQLADAVCRAFGRGDVAIHSGAERPMRGPQRPARAAQGVVLDRFPHREAAAFEPDAAVPFLREMIRSRPGEITLVSIGPLTNLGLLYALDPEVPRLLRRHVMMGGLYRGAVAGYGPVETNAGADPHAVDLVMRAPVPELWCVGLEVTARCRMAVEAFRRWPGERAFGIIREMAEVWLRGSPGAQDAHRRDAGATPSSHRRDAGAPRAGATPSSHRRDAGATQDSHGRDAGAPRAGATPSSHRRDAGATQDSQGRDARPPEGGAARMEDSRIEVAERQVGNERVEIVFHDPLAAVWVFEPGLVRFAAGRVEVELAEGPTAGRTRFVEGGDEGRGGDQGDMAVAHGRHRVAVEVDPEAFFEHYVATVHGSAGGAGAVDRVDGSP